jgi:hypothetical protein
MADDFYALLGVRRDASAHDVADALRLELMKWSRRASNSPRDADRAEADQRVELLGEAKVVLGDPVRRAQYDREMGFTQPQPQPVPVPAPVMPAPVLPTPVWPQQPAQSEVAPAAASPLVRNWYVPSFVPVVGPFVSWTYAAVTARSRRYARWALFYGVMFVLVVASSIVGGGSSDSSSSSSAFDTVFALAYVFGPMVQAVRRRHEVADAMTAPRQRS